MSCINAAQPAAQAPPRSSDPTIAKMAGKWEVRSHRETVDCQVRSCASMNSSDC